MFSHVILGCVLHVVLCVHTVGLLVWTLLVTFVAGMLILYVRRYSCLFVVYRYSGPSHCCMTLNYDLSGSVPAEGLYQPARLMVLLLFWIYSGVLDCV